MRKAERTFFEFLIRPQFGGNVDIFLMKVKVPHVVCQTDWSGRLLSRLRVFWAAAKAI